MGIFRRCLMIMFIDLHEVSFRMSEPVILNSLYQILLTPYTLYSSNIRSRGIKATISGSQFVLQYKSDKNCNFRALRSNTITWYISRISVHLRTHVTFLRTNMCVCYCAYLCYTSKVIRFD